MRLERDDDRAIIMTGTDHHQGVGEPERVLLLLAPWPGVGHYRGGDGPWATADAEA